MSAKIPYLFVFAWLLLSGGGVTLGSTTAPTTDFSRPESKEQFPGGTATSKKRVDRKAFSHPSANMGLEPGLDFKVGNGFFKRLWVTAPASTQAADGLGPL